jgi:tryptophan synthase alpha chain
MNGVDLVTQAFANMTGKALFMPYFPVGYPDLKTSIDIIEGLAKSGADLIEVGVPFSDPLADGPSIQYATQIALENGTTVRNCLAAIKEVRARGVEIPLILMSYVNPLLRYGLESLVPDAIDAGVSGFIVPDLPADEAGEFQNLVEEHGAAFAHFLAPTSNTERIELTAKYARGFIYLVSVTGITGERNAIPEDLRPFVERVRKLASQPLAVGFGIGSPEKARDIAEIADGVIIGSKLVNLAKESPQAVFTFAESVSQALK